MKANVTDEVNKIKFIGKDYCEKSVVVLIYVCVCVKSHSTK